MTLAPHPRELQGNVLRGYRSALRVVRYLMLEVTDAAAARAFLEAAVNGGSPHVPAIASDETWDEPPPSCFNVAFTYNGLAALGVPAQFLATFPREFAEGMAARAMKIGDFGEGAPDRWPAPFDAPERIHVVASIYAIDEEQSDEDGVFMLDAIQRQVARAFTVLGVRDGRAFRGDKVHFGFRDSISQPRFRKKASEDVEPNDPLGTILLGHPTRLEGLFFRVPKPVDLGLNGTFDAFRILEQDVAAFDRFLEEAAAEIEQRLPGAEIDALLIADDEKKILDSIFDADWPRPAGDYSDRTLALREIVAAQMCGRWRNGCPYASCPDVPDPAASLTEFDYTDDSRCPVGSHLRRVNPRGGAMVQRIANFTRRLVRRGMPYGPPYDPAKPDGAERGLLGNFIGANIAGQFEAVMADWLNLGLHHPSITRSNDPLIGANDSETSWFDLVLKDGSALRLRGFPRFVTARGGAYTFIPSMNGIRYLAAL